MCAGEGNDTAKLGAGKDRAYGEAGSDRLFGGSGRDALFGEGGRDRLVGGAGKGDRCVGGGVEYLTQGQMGIWLHYFGRACMVIGFLGGLVAIMSLFGMTGAVVP